MALSLLDSVLTWRKVNNALQGATGYRPAAQLVMAGLQSYLKQQGGNPRLQVVFFDDLSSSEVVIADVACKLYALVLLKDTATATFTKATDNATTSSDADSEIRIWQNGAELIDVLACPMGKPFANGITMQGNTTASGGTGSSTNGGRGFALIGAA